MKIIINTSTLLIGGGMQVAISLINELRGLTPDNDYHIFLSQNINKQIDQNSFPNNFHFYLIEKSPASLKYRKSINAKLNELEKVIKPNIVFTVFGPSYWRPRSIHLMGLANGWIYNPNTIAYKRLSLKKRIKNKALTKLRTFLIKKDAQYYVVETRDAKSKIIKNMNIDKNHIYVVGNTYSAIFNDFNLLNSNDSNFLRLPAKRKDTFRLVLISHNYPHKNLKIIKDVIPYLSQHNVEFILTIDDVSYENLFHDLKDIVINLGPIKQNNCPSVYKQSDALFFPTLLETFSASYPEAMKMELPILTSNYSFATDICGDAALYFDPLNPEDIANKIKMLINNKSLQTELVNRGEKRLEVFETSQSRAEKYLALFEIIVKENNGLHKKNYSKLSCTKCE